jgi:hypothetical protein
MIARAAHLAAYIKAHIACFPGMPMVTSEDVAREGVGIRWAPFEAGKRQIFSQHGHQQRDVNAITGAATVARKPGPLHRGDNYARPDRHPLAEYRSPELVLHTGTIASVLMGAGGPCCADTDRQQLTKAHALGWFSVRACPVQLLREAAISPAPTTVRCNGGSMSHTVEGGWLCVEKWLDAEPCADHGERNTLCVHAAEEREARVARYEKRQAAHLRPLEQVDPTASMANAIGKAIAHHTAESKPARGKSP